MANRKLTAQDQTYYDEPGAWHWAGASVYHVAPNCPTGHDLTPHPNLDEDYQEGTGGLPKCPVCTTLVG